jgi:hypothetical protein
MRARCLMFRAARGGSRSSFAREVKNYFGADISQEMLDVLARDKAKKRITYRNG